MTFQMDNLKEMEVRLCRLEKQNRRIKAVGTAALVVVATLVVMGQAPSGKAIKADVVETKVLNIINDEGELRGQFSDAGVSVGDPKGDFSSLLPTHVSAANAKGGVMTLGPESLVVEGANGSRAGLSPRNLGLENANGDTTVLFPGTVGVKDAQGYRAVLGVSLVGSEDKKYKTTAAALKLYDKKKIEIWSTPQTGFLR